MAWYDLMVSRCAGEEGEGKGEGDIVRCEAGGACGEGRGTFGRAGPTGRRRGVLCCCVWGARRCAAWGGLGRGRHRVEGEEGRVCMHARYQCNCTQTMRGKEKARVRAHIGLHTHTRRCSGENAWIL